MILLASANQKLGHGVPFLAGMAISLLTGCALAHTSPPPATVGAAIQGVVHGGQQPYVQSQVYLFAANTTGYGNASVSLLKAGPTTIYDANNTDATYGDYYVPTDANGNFSITGDYTCTPNTQVYIYAVGGRPAGQNILANTAAGFLAALGNCPSVDNFATTAPYIAVNEVSTVATAYAIAGFATDAVHVSSSGTALAQIGIANAFANVTNLESLSTGAALAKTPAGNGTSPQATINTLANILAACVNTNDVTSNTNGSVLSSACQTLLSLATSDGTTNGTQPGDTATAAINMAHHPAANIANLYALSTPTPPFAPTLSTQPYDFTVGFIFTGGGMNNPSSMAVDGAGNVWIVNAFGFNSLSKFSSLGAAISPSSGYTGGGLNVPVAMAIDASGNIWVANEFGNSVSEFSNSGAAISAASGYTGGGLYEPFSIAVDAAGNVWVANDVSAKAANGGSISKFSSSGAPISSSVGFGAGGSHNFDGIAIDGSGSVWTVANGLSKFSNSGAILGVGYPGGGGINGNGQASIAFDDSGNAWTLGGSGLNVLETSNSGTATSPSGGYTGGGVGFTDSLAIDGAGNVWVTNNTGNTGNSVSEFSKSGTALSPSLGYAGGIPLYPGGLLFYPGPISVDGSGNLWITDVTNSTLSEIIGIATPVITPICAGLPSTPTSNGSSSLGTRP
jgi:hypothetical protein